MTTTKVELAAGGPEQSLMIDGPAGPLALRVQVPAEHRTGWVAVVCHPHPLFGGSMDNKVVATLCRAYRDLGLAVVRFNFRGVGASAGVFDHGQGEQEDLRAVLAWVGDALAARDVCLAGFSFGSYVASAVWLAPPDGFCLRELVLVAPPVTRYALPAGPLPASVRILYGDTDEVVEPAAIADWVRQAQGDAAVKVLVGAGHFFHGRLNELKDWVMSTGVLHDA